MIRDHQCALQARALLHLPIDMFLYNNHLVERPHPLALKVDPVTICFLDRTADLNLHKVHARAWPRPWRAVARAAKMRRIPRPFGMFQAAC
eukprot:4406161-Pyramimonas_sp.AAC.1